jgi:NitT/TauT family transport system substrate-binding protein
MIQLGSLLLVTALTLAAPPAEKKKVRVGHFPNLTHAQGVIGHGLSRTAHRGERSEPGSIGWFEQRLGPDVEIEWYVYNAGPGAMEALLAGSIDLTYVGPNPALNAYIRSEGDEVRIVAGACSGGAALVVQPDGRIQEDGDFREKKIASPQLGNTQDVAARAWLKSRGLRITQTGGDALVLPTANPDQLTLFQKGDLDAVWTVEPWVTRLELEAGGRVYLEEKELWPETGGRYVTTHLASSVEFLQDEAELVRRFVEAHVELTVWINAHADEAKQLLNAEIQAETSKGIAPGVLELAWSRIEITYDPVRASLMRCARDAHAAGFLEEDPDLTRIYALDQLEQVLARKGLPGVL